MKRLPIISLALLFVSGCATPDEREVQILRNNQAAVENLVTQLKNNDHLKHFSDIKIAVTTLANVQDTTVTGLVGQISGEEIASALVRYGFQVAELKLGDGILVYGKAAEDTIDNRNGDGEFLLTRNPSEDKDLSSDDREKLHQDRVLQLHNQLANIKYIVVGTYGEGPSKMLITLRIVDLRTGLERASVDYLQPLIR